MVQVYVAVNTVHILWLCNANNENKCLRVPQRGQHSPSGTVALAQGIRGQEILRHTVAEFCESTEIKCTVTHVLEYMLITQMLLQFSSNFFPGAGLRYGFNNKELIIV